MNNKNYNLLVSKKLLEDSFEKNLFVYHCLFLGDDCFSG